MFSKLGLLLLRALGYLPLSWLRALGAGLGGANQFARVLCAFERS
jgi:hypothetical protein